MKVGFIGLGGMGRPIAQHLLAAGHELTVWARRAASAAPLVEAGAARASSPAAVAAASEVVFTVVTGTADVLGLVRGPEGLAAGFARDGVLVDCSTIAPEEARCLAAELAAQGVRFVDAPVSGGIAGAEAGTLAVMAGAEAAVLDRVQPLLACFASRVVHIGPNGAGQVAKACNQLIMVAAIQACAEATALARAAGVDAAAVHQALKGGSAASRVLEVMGARMLNGHYAHGVDARLHHKDFALALDAAQRLGVPMPVAGQVWQQLNALMGQGRGYDDTAALVDLVAKAGR